MLSSPAGPHPGTDAAAAAVVAAEATAAPVTAGGGGTVAGAAMHVPPRAADGNRVSRWRQRHAATCRASDARPTELTCCCAACCYNRCRHQQAGLPLRLSLHDNRPQLRRRDVCAAHHGLWHLRVWAMPPQQTKKYHPCAAQSTGMGLGANASQTKYCSCQRLNHKHFWRLQLYSLPAGLRPVAAAAAAAPAPMGRCRVAMKVSAAPAVQPKCMKPNIEVDTMVTGGVLCA